MNNLNSFIMDGHLASDPEMGKQGDALCTFSVGVNRTYKDSKKEIHEEVAFIRVEVWGAMSTSCLKYLKKGDAVRVMGRLKENKWETPDGIKHSRIVVHAERVDFLSKKKRDEVVTIDVENGTSTVEEIDTV